MQGLFSKMESDKYRVRSARAGLAPFSIPKTNDGIDVLKSPAHTIMGLRKAVRGMGEYMRARIQAKSYGLI